MTPRDRRAVEAHRSDVPNVATDNLALRAADATRGEADTFLDIVRARRAHIGRRGGIHLESP